MRHSRALLAGTLSLLALAMGALVPPAAIGAQAPAASPKPKSDQPLGEGAIRLRREGPTIDLDSVIDSNQPDFYINVEILPTPTPKPEPFPTPLRSTTPELTLDQTPAPTIDQTPAPTMGQLPAPTAAPTALPAASPTPQKPSVDLMYQAQRLATMGQYQRSLGLIEDAIGQDPDRASLHAVRGSVLFKLKDYAEAEAAWTKALELDPNANDVKESLQWLRKRRASSQLDQ